MAGIQVIGRQPQSPTDAANSLSQIIERKNQLTIQKQIASTNAKNATTEQDKVKQKSVADALGLIENFNAKGIPMTPDLLRQIAQVNSIGDQALFQALAQVGTATSQAQSPETLKTRAETAESEADTGIKQQQLRILEGMGGGGQGVQGQGSSSNGPLLTGMNIGGMSFEDPQAKGQVAAEETRAREMAKTQVDLAPTKNIVNAYMSQFARAYKEIGGLPEIAAGAFIKGGAYALASNVAKLPEVQAFQKTKEATALSLASYVNRGRPTEPDRAAMEAVMPSIMYPLATNKALLMFMTSLLADPAIASDTTRQVFLDPRSLDDLRNGKPIAADAVGGVMFSRIRHAKEVLVQDAQQLAEQLRSAGASEEQINQRLDKYYGDVLHNLMPSQGGF